MIMKLVRETDFSPVVVGDKVTTFRGEVGTLMSVHPPGRVTVKLGGVNGYYYAAVIGCRFVPEDMVAGGDPSCT